MNEANPPKDKDPQLGFGEDGVPRSGRFGDIYFSVEDGLEETRHVFFKGCGLPEAWQDRMRFCVAELGFGTGLNIAGLLELWARTRMPGAQLNIFSLEGFLMSREDAAQALKRFPTLHPFIEALLAQWPQVRTGFHYMDFPQWGAHFTLALMPVPEALSAWQGRADAWFLDGFSPALNPDMWSEAVMQAIADHSAPGARLATFTAASAVRRALMATGFLVEKQPGYGRKRERLVARWPQADLQSPPSGPVAIVGAGIAGACVAHHARGQGLEVVVFDEAGVGSGASGNFGAIVTPRLDAGAADITALFSDAIYYACDFYRQIAPEAVMEDGIDLLACKPKDPQRFATFSHQSAYAAGDLHLVEGNAGEPILRIAPALSLKPPQVLAALLKDVAVQAEKIVRIEGEAGAFFLSDDRGETHGPFAAVVLCLGEGILDWPDLPAGAELRPVRGQMEYLAGSARPEKSLSWGGYCAAIDTGFIFGATHDRDDRGRDVREADSVANYDSFTGVLPELAQTFGPNDSEGRASVRIMSRDYLPVCGQLQTGVHVLTGLGSRGFCLAPLLGRALAHAIAGGTSPLQADITRRIHPQRFKI